MQQYHNDGSIRSGGGYGALSKADMWLMVNAYHFKPEHIISIRDTLLTIPEDRLDILHTLNLNNPTVILVLSIFLGQFGVDRFMIGDIGLGIGKLLTLGGCGIWHIIDLFLISERVKNKNYEVMMRLPFSIL